MEDVTSDRVERLNKRQLEQRHKIMLVDDNTATLTIGRKILHDHYEVFPVPSAAKLFTALERVTPDIILLDIEMPEMNGYQAMRKLREDTKFSDIPVVFVTSNTDEGSELAGLGLGAIDYIRKPFSAPLLLRRLENHLLTISQKKELARYNTDLNNMVLEQSGQILGLQDSMLKVIADLVESRDDVTGSHVARVESYLQLLAGSLLDNHIYAEETADWNNHFLFSSSQLHDVGKIAISDTILNKPGKLTDEEFTIMKTHVVLGVHILDKIESDAHGHTFLHHAKRFAAYHHEKWDGSGYPNGLAGLDIPLEGRLLAIADVYDALISARPYKPPMPTAKAAAIIMEGSGTHFDPALVAVFAGCADGCAAIATGAAH